MTAIDPRATLHTALSFTHKNLVNDLNALSEEQAGAGPSADTRSAVSIVAECAAVNNTLAGFLATNEFAMPTPEQRAAYFASITTREQAIAALESATQNLRDAIDARPLDTWGDPVTDIFGAPSTVFAIAQFAPMHMMYHDGQLNYLHTVHGDAQMHW